MDYNAQWQLFKKLSFFRNFSVQKSVGKPCQALSHRYISKYLR